MSYSDFIDALHEIYPQVTQTEGEVAFDADGNRVEYDRVVVEAKASQIQAKRNRAAAYRSEADPLFFKAQRGEATTDEWTAKVAEIKTRFPYPGGEE